MNSSSTALNHLLERFTSSVDLSQALTRSGFPSGWSVETSENPVFLRDVTIVTLSHSGFTRILKSYSTVAWDSRCKSAVGFCYSKKHRACSPRLTRTHRTCSKFPTSRETSPYAHIAGRCSSRSADFSEVTI